jgi:hypothetical protein
VKLLVALLTWIALDTVAANIVIAAIEWSLSAIWLATDGLELCPGCSQKMRKLGPREMRSEMWGPRTASFNKP